MAGVRLNESCEKPDRQGGPFQKGALPERSGF